MTKLCEDIVLKSLRFYNLKWHKSLNKYDGIIATLKENPYNNVAYWEFQGTDTSGQFIGNVLASFSVDCVPNSKNPDPKVIKSDRFANFFMKYAEDGGIDKAMSNYKIIPRIEDDGLGAILELSKQEIEAIRDGISGNIQDLSKLNKAALVVIEKFTKLTDSLPDMPDNPTIEERVDGAGMRCFYIKGTNILHRENGPAAIGTNNSKMWMSKGQLHREDGPAIVFPDGASAHWYNGKLHCADGPAVISANGECLYAIHGMFVSKEAFEAAHEQQLAPQATDSSVSWTKDGVSHNNSGPAIFTSDATFWAQYGFLHREDGPAAVYLDGKKGYFIHGFIFEEQEYNNILSENLTIKYDSLGGEDKNEDYRNHRLISFSNKDGKKHREGGPAVIDSYGSRHWYINGRLHNASGPACINRDGTKSYFLHGFPFSKEEHQSIVSQNLTIDFRVDKLYFYEDDRKTLHRVGGPAVIGENFQQWNLHGMNHRENGPAVIYGNNQEYYIKDLLHRADGPAKIFNNGDKHYFLNGLEHNTNGPAKIFVANDKPDRYAINGVEISKETYDEVIAYELEIDRLSNGDIVFSKESDGNYHRINGPAVRRASGIEEWYFDGELHNEGGPAVKRLNNEGDSYYLMGLNLSKDEYDKLSFDTGTIVFKGKELITDSDGKKEWIKIDTSDTKNDFGIKIDNIAEDIDLEAFLEAADELATESIELAGLAAKIGIIASDPETIINYCKTIRNLPEDSRAGLKTIIEKANAEQEIQEFLDEEEDKVGPMTEDTELDNNSHVDDMIYLLENEHIKRKEHHMSETVTLSPFNKKDSDVMVDAIPEKDESFGFFPTIAGAALVALAGAAVSGKKAKKAKKKQEKKEEVVV